MADVFGYLVKSKRGLGQAFGAHFLYYFFHKNVTYLIHYQWTKFQCHTLFLSQDIKQCVIRFLFRQLTMSINFKIFLGSSSEALQWREQKGLFR